MSPLRQLKAKPSRGTSLSVWFLYVGPKTPLNTKKPSMHATIKIDKRQKQCKFVLHTLLVLGHLGVAVTHTHTQVVHAHVSSIVSNQISKSERRSCSPRAFPVREYDAEKSWCA